MKTSLQTTAEPSKEQQDAKRLNGIKAAIRDGAIPFALGLLNGWIAKEPNRGDLHLLKGVALHLDMQVDAAKAELIRASQMLPGASEPLLRLGHIAKQEGSKPEEIRWLRKALPLESKNNKVLGALLQLEWETKDFEPAIKTAERLLVLNPDDVDVDVRRIWCIFELGRKEEAMAVLEKALRGPKPDDKYILAWSEMAADRMRQLETAVKVLTDVSKRAPDSWILWACLGKTYHKLERIPQALEALNRAVAIDPNQAVCWFDIGVMERERGRAAESEAALQKSLDAEPLSAPVLRIIGYEHKYAYGDDAFKKVNRVLARSQLLSEKHQVEIFFAAAKAFEDVGELDTAFDYYARAGAMQKRMLPWSETRMNGVLALMRQYINKNDLEAARQKGAKTQQPVFVFGMPRSGTTLIEQVIASHPEAYGAGELKLGARVLNGIQVGRVNIETIHVNSPHDAPPAGITIGGRGEMYLRELQSHADGDYKRIVDKMPGNYNWAGLLDVILPGCYLIHARRHPVEICLSEYRIYFPDGIPFSYDLQDLGKAYKQYLNYMKFWTSMVPKERILHVRYEDMVGDFENQARRLIDFVGLPWNDACLKFYETERSVRTASVTQVRRPIYKDSVGRWRKYEPYLKPLLDELGPLVQEYEEELEGVRPPLFG